MTAVVEVVFSHSGKRLRLDVNNPQDFTDYFSATSKATVRGVTVLNQTDDKSRTLNQHNLLLFSGESGDTIQFAEFVQANVQLYGMKNDTELNSDAVAAFTRREMADNLRTRVSFFKKRRLTWRMHIKCCWFLRGTIY